MNKSPKKGEQKYMSSWHLSIGMVIVLIAVYLVGVKFPAPGRMALGKVGL